MRASQRKIKEFLKLAQGYGAKTQNVSRDSLSIRWTDLWDLVAVKWHPGDDYWTVNYNNWNEQYKLVGKTRTHPLSCNDIKILTRKIKMKFRNWANYD